MAPYQRRNRLPHYAHQTRQDNPIPVQRWSIGAASGEQPFNTGQCFLLAGGSPHSIHTHTTLMSSKCSPALCQLLVFAGAASSVYESPSSSRLCAHTDVLILMWTRTHKTDRSKPICPPFLSCPVLGYTEHCAACSNQTQTARVYQNADSSPSKHEDLTQCCFNVGPAPLAVGQYWNSLGSNPRVCWAPHRCLSTPTPPHHNILASRSGYF